jgi:hypothetical protein
MFRKPTAYRTSPDELSRVRDPTSYEWAWETSLIEPASPPHLSLWGALTDYGLPLSIEQRRRVSPPHLSLWGALIEYGLPRTIEKRRRVSRCMDEMFCRLLLIKAVRETPPTPGPFPHEGGRGVNVTQTRLSPQWERGWGWVGFCSSKRPRWQRLVGDVCGDADSW